MTLYASLWNCSTTNQLGVESQNTQFRLVSCQYNQVTIVNIAHKYLCLRLVIVLVCSAQLCSTVYVLKACHLLFYQFVPHTIWTFHFDGSLTATVAFHDAVWGSSYKRKFITNDKSTRLHLKAIMRCLHLFLICLQGIL